MLDGYMYQLSERCFEMMIESELQGLLGFKSESYSDHVTLFAGEGLYLFLR